MLDSILIQAYVYEEHRAIVAPSTEAADLGMPSKFGANIAILNDFLMKRFSVSKEFRDRMLIDFWRHGRTHKWDVSSRNRLLIAFSLEVGPEVLVTIIKRFDTIFGTHWLDDFWNEIPKWQREESLRA